MKQKQLSVRVVIFSLIAISFFTYGFRNVFVPGHKYTLTHTEENWNKYLGGIDSARTLLLNSDLPAKTVVSIVGKLAELEQSMQVQIGQQIQADTIVKPKK